MKLDANSRNVLRELQRDATLSAKELAERLAMSQTTVWRRIQDLEAAGIIKERTTVLDPRKLELDVCTLIEVKINSQGANARQEFERFVRAHENVTHCFSLTGEHDYAIVTYARSIEEYEDFLMNALLAHPSVESSVTNLVLKQIKNTTALPI